MSNNVPSLKTALEKELSKTNIFASGIEGATAAAQAISSVNQNESNNIETTTVMNKKPLKKGISDKLVGSNKIKTPLTKLTTGLPIMGEEQEMDENWSEKYKKSIDCNNPKGFSQKAHCQGRKKENKESMGASAAGGYGTKLFSTSKGDIINGKIDEEKLKGGISDNKTFNDLVKKYKSKDKDLIQLEKELKSQLDKGIKVEMEHTKDKNKAKEIAMDHLFEDPKYYDKLKKMETNEACWKGYKEVGGKMKNGKMVPNCVKEGKEDDIKKVEATEETDSSSSGQYSTTAAWAKSTSKKDWRGKSKPQIPGGKFVQVKKKCKKFPYCNQGDIKALKIFENEKVKQAIQNISKRHNISENVIKTIIAYEYENTFPKK